MKDEHKYYFSKDKVHLHVKIEMFQPDFLNPLNRSDLN